MKKLILSLVFTIILSSCGKSNQVSFSDSVWNSNFSASTKSGAKSTSAAVSDVQINFEGNYDLIQMGNKKCGASIQITKACNGYEITSNYSQPEKLCHVNKGEITTTEITSTEVTQKNNELKLVNYLVYNSRHGKRDILTSKSMTLKPDGTMIISFDLTKKTSRCVYFRR